MHTRIARTMLPSLVATGIALAGCGTGPADEPEIGTADEAVLAANARRTVSLSSGYYDTCFINPAGGIECMGHTQGMLGDGDKTPSSATPTPVQGIKGAAVAVGVGLAHACALLDDGTVTCWGASGCGQVGNGEMDYEGALFPPAPVVGLSDIVAISVGPWHSCALRSDGEIACWGDNMSGGVGDPDYGQCIVKPTFVTPPEPTAGRYVHVSVGAFTTCARRADGTAVCWGNNEFHQVGLGPSRGYLPTPIPIPGPVTSIATAHHITCATLPSGSVKCWGYRDTFNGGPTPAPYVAYGGTDAVEVSISGPHLGPGQTGYGDRTLVRRSNGGVSVLEFGSPTAVSQVSDAVAVSAGFLHSCVVHADGGISCWDDNTYGQLGDGTTISRSTPLRVPGAVTAAAPSLALGRHHTCVKRAGSPLRCWGKNTSGQLADGTIDSRASTGSDMASSFEPVAVTAGEAHTCVLGARGQVMCAGLNGPSRIIGAGTSNDIEAKFLSVNGLATKSPSVAVAAGANHTCALSPLGYVRCWGANESGQLGVGDTLSRPQPTWVATPQMATIATGTRHTCAVTIDGALYCWGRNTEGQLGVPGAGSLTPVLVPGLPLVVSVAAGADATCAITSDGSMYCWGSNSVGQLGRQGPSTYAPTLSMTDVQSASLGHQFGCALGADGRVRCFGSNSDGQIGSNAGASTSVPTHVTGLGQVIAIGAGGSHACALTAANDVMCWGNGEDGQLGTGKSDSSSVAVPAVF